MIRFLGMLLVAGIATFATPSEAQQKLDKLTVPASDGLHVFAMYVARSGDFFAKENIEPDFVNVAAGPRQVAALVGGSADLLYVSLLQIIKARAEGADIVAIGSVFEVYGVKLALTNEAIAKAGITPDLKIDEKVKRLQGLKIGISTPGSSTDAFVRSLLLARGYDPDKTVNLQPLGNGAALLAAFEKKLIDGLAWPAPVPEIVERRGIGKTVIDPFSSEIPELNGVPYLVMATSRQTLEKKSDLLKRAVRATNAAMEYNTTHPQESCNLVRQYFKDVEEDVYKAACEAYRKGVPRKLELSKESLDKTLVWMNLGSSTPVTAKYDELVGVLK